MSKAVLVVGKIREPEKFSLDVEKYVSWLKAGKVDKLVFSGWVSDLHQNRRLLDVLARAGGRIVLDREPDITLIGSILHQMVALHNGLSVLDPDDVVLKSRTDKVAMPTDPGTIFARFTSAEPPAAQSPFRRRILVPSALAWHPFFFNDGTYVGLAGDLAQLVTFDLWYVARNALINGEQVFHTAPFRKGCAFLDEYFKVNPGLVWWDDADLARRLDRARLDEPLHLAAVARSLQAIESSYAVGYHAIDDTVGDLPPSWHHLLERDAGISRKLVYSKHSNAWVLTAGGVASLLLDLPISPDRPQSLRSCADLSPELLRRRAGLCEAAWQMAERLSAAFPGLRNPPRLPSCSDDGSYVVMVQRASLVVPR